MKSTTNHGLQKPEPLINNVNIDVINMNMDIVDKGLAIYLGSTSGSANAYTIASDNIKALSEGLAVCIKIHTASSEASTLNINGWGAKTIKKAGGADATNLKASIYTLRYDGENFILQGEGASGDAAASDLLLGKKATTDAGEITGTMPDIGPVEAETVNLTSQNQEYVIAYGRHSGLRKIKAVISGLIAGVIKAGVTVGGILGTYTSDATATDGDVLSGKFYYRNGVKGTGNIPSKAAQTYTPSIIDQEIVAGQYLSGAQIIKGEPTLIPDNIPEDMKFFDIQGIRKLGLSGAAGVTAADTVLTNFTMQNGNQNSSYKLTVSGLTFLPKTITARYAVQTGWSYVVNYWVNGSIAVLVHTMVHSDGVSNSNPVRYRIVSPVSITETGFVIPVPVSTNWEWIARP